MPFAIRHLPCALLLQTYHNDGDVFGGDLRRMALQVFAGPITALLLIVLRVAARGLAMTTVGLLRYIDPTLQNGCAVWVFREPFGGWHLAVFALVGMALAFYSVAALR